MARGQTWDFEEPTKATPDQSPGSRHTAHQTHLGRNQD
jgi:hypothetical protein